MAAVGAVRPVVTDLLDDAHHSGVLSADRQARVEDRVDVRAARCVEGTTPPIARGAPAGTAGRSYWAAVTLQHAPILRTTVRGTLSRGDVPTAGGRGSPFH